MRIRYLKLRTSPIFVILVLITSASSSLALASEWPVSSQQIVKDSNTIKAENTNLLLGALTVLGPVAGSFPKDLTYWTKANGCFNMLEGIYTGLRSLCPQGFSGPYPWNVNPKEAQSCIDLSFPNKKQANLYVSKEQFKVTRGILSASYWEPTKNAPKAGKKLAVYLPGIFQGANHFFTHRAVQLLADNGFTVLVIPNSMSSEYMNLRPVASAGDFEKEAQVVLTAIEVFKKQHVDIRSVDLLGASYGGYLAAVVAALDSQSKKPLIDRQTTLIGPIYSMQKSADILDKWIDKSLPIKTRVQSEMDLSLAWYQLAERNYDLIPKVNPCLAVGLMFHQSLGALLDHMTYNYQQDDQEQFSNKNYSRGTKDKFDDVDLDNDEYVNSLRFSFIIKNFMPETASYYRGEKDSLGYWMKLAGLNGNKRIRIITGANDFLAPKRLFNDLPDWARNDEHILYADFGGHNGYIFDSWFDPFVAAAFPQK